jgi:hypothetical protein
MPMTDEEKSNLQSLYAGRHKMHLLQNYPQMIASMQAKGTLEAYLQEIGQSAARMYELIIDQMTEKAAQMPETKRQSYLDSAPLVASEIVNTDIVYVKL